MGKYIKEAQSPIYQERPCEQLPARAGVDALFIC